MEKVYVFDSAVASYPECRRRVFRMLGVVVLVAIVPGFVSGDISGWLGEGEFCRWVTRAGAPGEWLVYGWEATVEDAQRRASSAASYEAVRLGRAYVLPDGWFLLDEGDDYRKYVAGGRVVFAVENESYDGFVEDWRYQVFSCRGAEESDWDPDGSHDFDLVASGRGEVFKRATGLVVSARNQGMTNAEEV